MIRQLCGIYVPMFKQKEADNSSFAPRVGVHAFIWNMISRQAALYVNDYKEAEDIEILLCHYEFRKNLIFNV